MKKIITAINVVIALYFFILANLFFWGYFLTLIVNTFKRGGTPEIFWSSVIEMILAPFLIYGSIIFFRKTKRKYLYGLVILGIIWIESLVYRLFFVTHGKLEQTDLSNTLFFGIPFIIILLTQYLDKKISEGTINKQIFYRVLIVIMSIVLIVGGIFAWQYFGVSKEITDWKTYKNEKYGIEFQYPNSWALDDKEALSVDLPDQTKNFLQINVSNGAIGREDESMSPCQPGLASIVYQVGKSRDGQQSFEEFVNFQIENPERGMPPTAKPELISTTVGAHNALKIEGTIDNCATEFYYVEQNLNKYLTISFIADKNDDKLLLNQILSTLKFIEIQDETANWQTYQNTEYGFEVKYPQEWEHSTSQFPLYERFAQGFGGINDPNGFACIFEVEPILTESMVNIDDYINNIYFAGRPDLFPPIKETNINGISARKVEMSSHNFGYWIKRDEAKFSLNISLIIETTGRNYKYLDGSDNECLKIFNQMFSTFRFLGAKTTEEKTEPYIKVLSPNGGEEWQEGKTYTIQWELSEVNKVNIEYGDGKSWYIVLDYPAATGEYSWTPPKESLVNMKDSFIRKTLLKLISE